MKKTIFCILFSLCISISYSQDEKNFEYKFSGFIRSDIWYDNKDNYSAIDGLLFLYPKKIQDQNESLNFQTLLSRVGATVKGPEIFGANAMSYLEADVSAYSNTNSIRFRQAFIKLTWEKSNLLIGRTWHPLFNTSCFPTVISANTGAPFHPFNRSPQINYTHNLKNLSISGALVFQSDFKNTGPNGPSSEYFKNATQPELITQIKLKTGSFLTGFTAEYKTLQPRQYSTSYTDIVTTIPTNEKISTYALNLFINYSKNKLNIKTSGIYGQNLYESVMLGGYAVSKIDSISGQESYTPYNNLSVWTNIVYGDLFKIGLFGGYIKNLGASDHIIDDLSKIYVRGKDIDHLYRLSGFLSYNFKNLQVAFELDYTTAAYGVTDLANKGKVINYSDYSNFKSLLILCYYF